MLQENGRHQGNISCRDGTIKDRQSKDLTEAEVMKKRQEYTELIKKGFNELDNHNGVVTHVQPNILECEVGLRQQLQTKLMEVMEFQLRYFKS